MTTARSFRAHVHDWLDPREDDPLGQRIFNLAIIALIVANVAAVCLETVPGVYAAHAIAFDLLEACSITFFSIELVLRAWASVEEPAYQGRFGRLRFLLSPLALLDLIAIVPFYLAFFGIPADLRLARVLRVLRLFVLLRLVRYSAALRTLAVVFYNQKEELAVTAAVGGIVLLLASGTMYQLEHQAQPEAFASIPAALWWGVITLATVGYGDVYPITPAGRLLGGLFAVIGVGLFALPAGILASGFAEELRSRRTTQAAPPCPHCGKRPDEPGALA